MNSTRSIFSNPFSGFRRLTSHSYIGSLFSIRGPRDTTALLDIERALNKLEKVALRRRKEAGKPLVLIINSTHLLRDDDDGRDLLELIQQRAEQWAASNLVTIGAFPSSTDSQPAYAVK